MKKKIFDEILQRIEQGATDKEISELKAFNPNFYGDLLYEIIGLRFSEKEAHFYWNELLKHKYYISEKVGRNVGIYVAALDYFYNLKKMIKEPMIIEKRKFKSTEKRAKIDPLTHVYNRDYFLYQANNLIKAGRPFCIFFFDIDDFKMYNDLNGHLAGDVALMEVTRIARVLLERNEIIARWGGEEFVILFPNCHKQCAYEKAERFRKYVKDFPIANESVLPNKELTISGGLACYPEDGNAIENILAKADALLYKAKSEGKNKIMT